MMRITALFVFVFHMSLAIGQSLVETLPKIYHTDTNVIQYRYSNFPELLLLDLSVYDTISPGTDSDIGIVMTAYIGRDTLRIHGDNYPYERRSFVTVETPAGRRTILFRFNSAPSHFSREYILATRQKIFYETPEVYELANIIWTLSPSGRKAKDLQKNTPYYERVEKHFGPYMDHPVFARLVTSDSDYFRQYYAFRENSYMYAYRDGRIVKGEQYNYVFGDDWLDFTNPFSDNLALIQDFADKSGFRAFFQANSAFYASNSQEVQQLLPVQDMWDWLEREFPIRVDAYKIIYSPLILGSHSTQKYMGMMMTSDTSYAFYTETLMFICDAQHLGGFGDISAMEKQGLMSGIVFTEIDHNYVNPTSSEYWEEIEDIFKSDIWVEADMNNSIYDSPFAVFNEYMTHALFCLWVRERYDAQTADYVIRNRVEMNAGRRGFVRFEAFNTELFRLRDAYPGKTVAELYPRILEWSRGQR